MQCRKCKYKVMLKYLVKIIFLFICILNDIQLLFHFIHKFKASQIIFNKSFICWICVTVSLTFSFLSGLKKPDINLLFTCFHVWLKCFKTSPEQFNQSLNNPPSMKPLNIKFLLLANLIWRNKGEWRERESSFESSFCPYFVDIPKELYV